MEKKQYTNGPSCTYMLGIIGAAIYFIGGASGFWMGALGLLKAFVWPVFFVMEAFAYLNV